MFHKIKINNSWESSMALSNLDQSSMLHLGLIEH